MSTFWVQRTCNASRQVSKCPSTLRVAAGAFGFLLLSQARAGPDGYGASIRFETMPSRPRSQARQTFSRRRLQHAQRVGCRRVFARPTLLPLNGKSVEEVILFVALLNRLRHDRSLSWWRFCSRGSRLGRDRRMTLRFWFVLSLWFMVSLGFVVGRRSMVSVGFLVRLRFRLSSKHRFRVHVGRGCWRFCENICCVVMRRVWQARMWARDNCRRTAFLQLIIRND